MRLERYRAALNKVSLEYIDDQDYAALVHRPYTVLVMLEKHGSVDELVDSVTHEVVHCVHPSWEDEYDQPTDRVRERVALLVRSEKWRLTVYRRLAEELLRVLKGEAAVDVVGTRRRRDVRCR